MLGACGKNQQVGYNRGDKRDALGVFAQQFIRDRDKEFQAASCFHQGQRGDNGNNHAQHHRGGLPRRPAQHKHVEHQAQDGHDAQANAANASTHQDTGQ